MPAAHLCYLPARELARRIREGELSSVEVVRAHLDQIARHNPQLRAVATVAADAALAEAARADARLARGQPCGPLHGLPMTLKDLSAVRGMRSTGGLYKNHVPQVDAPPVARLRAAGAILIGRTNVPPVGFDWQTKNMLFGRSNNPWDPTRTPGGSGGGAAAALAAGMTPLELGSDLGGSIRVPAHCCGIAGLRPTEGVVWRVHLQGVPAAGPYRQMGVGGPMARCVSDLQLLYPILAGGDPQDLTLAPARALAPATRPPGENAIAELAGMRLGYAMQLGNVPACDETTAALERLVSRLQAAGATVEAASPAGSIIDRAVDLWGHLTPVQLAESLPWPLRRQPLRAAAVALTTLALFGCTRETRTIMRGGCATLTGYLKMLQQRQEIAGAMDAFLQPYDAWLTPVLPMPAFEHRRTGKAFSLGQRKVAYLSALAPYVCATVIPGHPIAVTPMGYSRSRLPIGVQIHTRRWTDYRTLEIAAAIERLTPREPFPYEMD